MRIHRVLATAEIKDEMIPRNFRYCQGGRCLAWSLIAQITEHFDNRTRCYCEHFGAVTEPLLGSLPIAAKGLILRLLLCSF